VGSTEGEVPPEVRASVAAGSEVAEPLWVAVDRVTAGHRVLAWARRAARSDGRDCIQAESAVPAALFGVDPAGRRAAVQAARETDRAARDDIPGGRAEPADRAAVGRDEPQAEHFGRAVLAAVPVEPSPLGEPHCGTSKMALPGVRRVGQFGRDGIPDD
jgi:hypothetical protein